VAIEIIEKFCVTASAAKIWHVRNWRTLKWNQKSEILFLINSSHLIILDLCIWCETVGKKNA